jgi:hypothetical protein
MASQGTGGCKQPAVAGPEIRSSPRRSVLMEQWYAIADGLRIPVVDEGAVVLDGKPVVRFTEGLEVLP